MDGYVQVALAILANIRFVYIARQASNPELVARDRAFSDPLGPIVFIHLWHSQRLPFAFGLTTAHLLVRMWLMLIRLWLCEQQYQPSPKITCLGVRDALREVYILSEPWIAIA